MPADDHAQLARLDSWFTRGCAAAGPGVVPCARSCSACCHGLFDISPRDAERLVEGLASLPRDEADALVSRARAQLAELRRRLPDWGSPHDVDALPEEVFDALCEDLARAPCPALDADGGCAVYAHRPSTCRMTGLGMDTGDADGLPNECPIQARHPAYAALAPVPFDLARFEDELAALDARAARRGYVTTTVSGALGRPSPPTAGTTSSP